MEYLLNHPQVVELIAALLSLVYLYFSIRKSVWLWPLGLISSLFSVVVYYYSKLYAELGLNTYYIAVSVYGWYHWLFWNKKDNEQMELPVSRITSRQIVIYLIGFVVFSLALYTILKNLTDSPIPFWDAVATSLSFIGTWMLARKILENWLVWIIADGLCAGIYIYKELYFFLVLFIIYTVMAYVGYRNWKKMIPEMQNSQLSKNN